MIQIDAAPTAFLILRFPIIRTQDAQDCTFDIARSTRVVSRGPALYA